MTSRGCRRIKQVAVASKVIELITCGAVPHYREILAGELVAMLMLSGEVTEHFERRYSGQVSLISSALAGRPIARSRRFAPPLTIASVSQIAHAPIRVTKLSASA